MSADRVQPENIGELKAHGGWVTAMAITREAPDLLLTASRDRSVIVWKITRAQGNEYAVPKRRLTGHSHFVQDVALSSDGEFALSGSWDGSLRLWNIKTGHCTRFKGHTKDVLSVSFSIDNRHIVSGSRDNTIRLWNTLGACKLTLDARIGGHTEWVSCVRFSPTPITNIVKKDGEDVEEKAHCVISGGWDKAVNIWLIGTQIKIHKTLHGHDGYISVVAVAPDGSLCASGGKDGVVKLWEIEHGKLLSSLPAGDVVSALAFSPASYWLAAATGPLIKIYNLEKKTLIAVVPAVEVENSKAKNRGKRRPVLCTSLAFSLDGTVLFAGYTDNLIRVWHMSAVKHQ